MARWVGVLVGVVLALGVVGCESGDPGPGSPDMPSGGAPGGPVGTDPGDGGAQGTPVTIPDFLNLSGGTPEEVEERIRYRIAEEACDGSPCLEVRVVNESSGTRNCTIGEPDPPTGSEVESGSTVTVPITCEDEETTGETTEDVESGDSSSEGS